MITEVLGSVGLGLVAYRLIWRPPNYPPGPRGLPLVGYAPFFVKMDPNYPHIAMAKLAETYGPVVGVWLGLEPHVFVTGAEAAKEAFFNEDLNGRPINPVFFERSFDGKSRRGITFWDGPAWLEQRRFQLRELRDLGWGRITTETVAHEEVLDLVSDLAKIAEENDGVVYMKNQFVVSVINILWTIVSGKRHGRKDKSFTDFLGKINAMFRAGRKINNYVIPMPFLRHLVPNLVGWTQFKEALSSTRKFIEEAIEDHKRTMGDEPRDFIDVYLKKMEEERKKGTAEERGFLDDQLVVSIFDIFAAGSETISSLLGFAILHMIRNPNIQLRTQEEIDRVVGRDRLPSLNDRPSMPYVEAVVMEVMRVNNVAMQTVPRRAMRDTILMGYNIPKDTVIHICSWSAHMDEEYWGDPKNFRPERHIDESGKLKKPGFQLMPFGFGKRSCAGEALARSTVFIFFTTLLQRFSYSIPPGHSRPSIRPLPGFTLAPQPFAALVKPRC